MASRAVLTGTREAQKGWGGFLIGLWGLLYRADRYSVEGSTNERFFVENRMAKKDQKSESLGKANTKGYKVVSARRKSVRLITRR